MFDLFFLGVLALLAFPVMAIVALIRANEARGLLWRLDSRVAALERDLAPAATLPAQPPAEPAPASPQAAAPAAPPPPEPLPPPPSASVPQSPPPSPATPPPAAGGFRGTGWHPLGCLDRWCRAGARRHISGALLDRAGPHRPGRPGDARRPAGAHSRSRRRADASRGEPVGAAWPANGAHSEHPDRCRHHRRLCHGVRSLRACRRRRPLFCLARWPC